MEDSPGLSPKQIIAAEATAAGASLAEAATAVGVALRTVSRWRGDPAFRAAVRLSAEAVTADARRALAALASEAVEALGRVLRSDDSPSSAVVSAVREVLDRTMGRPSQAVELAGALDVGPPEPREVRITLVEPNGNGGRAVHEEGGGGDPR